MVIRSFDLVRDVILQIHSIHLILVNRQILESHVGSLLNHYFR